MFIFSKDSSLSGYTHTHCSSCKGSILFSPKEEFFYFGLAGIDTPGSMDVDMAKKILEITIRDFTYGAKLKSFQLTEGKSCRQLGIASARSGQILSLDTLQKWQKNFQTVLIIDPVKKQSQSWHVQCLITAIQQRVDEKTSRRQSVQKPGITIHKNVYFVCYTHESISPSSATTTAQRTSSAFNLSLPASMSPPPAASMSPPPAASMSPPPAESMSPPPAALMSPPPAARPLTPPPAVRPLIPTQTNRQMGCSICSRSMADTIEALNKHVKNVVYTCNIEPMSHRVLGDYFFQLLTQNEKRLLTPEQTAIHTGVAIISSHGALTQVQICEKIISVPLRKNKLAITHHDMVITCDQSNGSVEMSHTSCFDRREPPLSRSPSKSAIYASLGSNYASIDWAATSPLAGAASPAVQSSEARAMSSAPVSSESVVYVALDLEEDESTPVFNVECIRLSLQGAVS